MEPQGRIVQIREIRGGAGDDVIDLTSQKYDFVIAEDWDLTIYGGDGDDVIWANGGSSAHLFGDAGDDHLYGTAQNDTFVGGSGDDTMHGCGGHDEIYFGGNWGNDTVMQLAGGSVALRFEEGDLNNWNATTKTYTYGSNSVTVLGDDIEISIEIGGTDAFPQTDVDEYREFGVFADATTFNIFEQPNQGTLVKL